MNLNADTLVTGASGLVGTHLVTTLAKQGKRVRALYSRSLPNISSGNIEWIQADILDVVALRDCMKGIRQVYHCAGKVSFDAKEKAMLYRVNVQGTANVVNACIETGVEKMVFISSVAALGRMRQGERINEAMQWTEDTNNSEYGKSKYLAEMEVWRGISEGLNAVIVNPSIILGAGNWNDGSTALFRSAYNEFAWYTTGVSGFVDVRDVVAAMMQLMDSGISAERFIVSSENMRFKELFTHMAHGFGKKPPHKKVSPWMAEVVWRIAYIKALCTGKKPLLTKETAASAQAVVHFDNSKIGQFLPQFRFTPIKDAVRRICGELKSVSH